MCIMWAGKERSVQNMRVRRRVNIVDAIESGGADMTDHVIRSHMDRVADLLVVSWGAAAWQCRQR